MTPHETSGVAPVVKSVVSRDPDLAERFTRKAAGPIPMLEYVVDRDAVSKAFADFSRQGEPVVEGNRFTIQAGHRGHGLGERHLAVHMFEAAVAYFLVWHIEHLFTIVRTAHVPFYRRYGLEELSGTTTRLIPKTGWEGTILHGRPRWLPDETKKRVASMARRLRVKNGACRCSAFPSCLPDGYESGRFDNDLFCPARACEILAMRCV